MSTAFIHAWQAWLSLQLFSCEDGLVPLCCQVHRLSTDFRAATRIVTERLPTAAELPPGTALECRVNLALFRTRLTQRAFPAAELL